MRTALFVSIVTLLVLSVTVDSIGEERRTMTTESPVFFEFDFWINGQPARARRSAVLGTEVPQPSDTRYFPLSPLLVGYLEALGAPSVEVKLDPALGLAPVVLDVEIHLLSSSRPLPKWLSNSYVADAYEVAKADKRMWARATKVQSQHALDIQVRAVALKVATNDLRHEKAIMCADELRLDHPVKCHLTLPEIKETEGQEVEIAILGTTFVIPRHGTTSRSKRAPDDLNILPIRE
jgi:hypothetical protein